jgi:hypothetical protein
MLHPAIHQVFAPDAPAVEGDAVAQVMPPAIGEAAS